MVEVNIGSNVLPMQITRFKIKLSVEIIMGDVLPNQSLASLGIFLFVIAPWNQTEEWNNITCDAIKLENINLLLYNLK